MLVDGNNFINHFIKNNKPLLAGKIGVNELKILHTYAHGYTASPDLKHDCETGAGLVPTDNENIKWFADLFFEALSNADIVCKWSKVIPNFEEDLINRNPKAYRTRLQDLEPYYFDKPWTEALKGKKVLVFSPFAKSFENNFKNFDKIWNKKIINNFELKAVNYPTSISITENSQFLNTKQIFEEYTNIIKTEEFDVGIFGTGCTGFLFANECKKIGKVGIHLGGATQMLFGVLGKRWINMPEFRDIINENWTWPLDSETPKGANIVEEACYWK